jgi:hypothetical protein
VPARIEATARRRGTNRRTTLVHNAGEARDCRRGTSRRETNPLRGLPRRETNLLRPTARRAPNGPNAPARNKPKATRPLGSDPRTRSPRNEPNGVLERLGRRCGLQARIRDEATGALGRSRRVCRRTIAARNEPKSWPSAAKTIPIAGAAPPKRTQSGGDRGSRRHMGVLDRGCRMLAGRGAERTEGRPRYWPPPRSLGTNRPTTFVHPEPPPRQIGLIKFRGHAGIFQ